MWFVIHFSICFHFDFWNWWRFNNILFFFAHFVHPDEVPKLLKVQTELLSLLTGMSWHFLFFFYTIFTPQNNVLIFVFPDIRKKNADIHKSVMLEMQICRQEIIEEVQQLKERISRMIELTRRTNYNQENFAFLEIADPDENGDDDSPSELSSDDEDVHERHDLFRWNFFHHFFLLKFKKEFGLNFEFRRHQTGLMVWRCFFLFVIETDGKNRIEYY